MRFKSILNLVIAISFFCFDNMIAQTSDLSIDMIVDNKKPNIRSNIKFTIAINNAGPDKATGVSILNEFANGYEIISISNDGTKAGNRIIWDDLTVPVNGNTFLHFTAKVIVSNEYNSRVEIIGSDNYDPNSDPELSFNANDLDDKYEDDDEFEITDIEPIPADFDKDGIFDFADIDDDNDGIPDVVESYGVVDPNADLDKDGNPVYIDDNDNNADIGDNNNSFESFFDFDGDGMPNHLDYDADGDGLYDVYESGQKIVMNIVKGKITAENQEFGVNGLFNKLEIAQNSNKLAYTILNTDNDENDNFLDTDDDNDGILTKNENADPNGDGNPIDAIDSDKDGIPDYLDNDSDGSASKTNKDDVVLEDETEEVKTATISTKKGVIAVKLFTQKGVEVTPEIQKIGNLVQVDVSKLESGIYFLQFRYPNKVDIMKMVID